MKPLTISDPDIIVGLQDEIRRSEESRYDHRLHGLLLVAHGLSCREVAQLLGDSPRTVQYWVTRFEKDGLAAMVEGERSGRPCALGDKELAEINRVLRQTPKAAGLGENLWDGKSLSAFVKKQFHVELGVRQCQRMFRQFGFRLRKPRPLIAHADSELQRRYKKN
ncbi:MAG TPA: helix-turn-helix domain-containing protein [Candidatus Binatus sp.]|nr:helix-turn-helix domain-containing protein [Candidatus Binatus sp.]